MSSGAAIYLEFMYKARAGFYGVLGMVLQMGLNQESRLQCHGVRGVDRKRKSRRARCGWPSQVSPLKLGLFVEGQLSGCGGFFQLA